MWETWVRSLGLEDPLEKGNPLPVLAWRIPMDRGAWWVIVHRVAQSRTQLSDQAQHSSTCGSQSMFPKQQHQRQHHL